MESLPNPPSSPEEFLSLLQSYQESGGSTEDLPADLQDLLAKVNEKKGGPSSDVPSEELVPEPGYVVKTVDDSGHKVFINMCSSTKVAAPGGWTTGQIPEAVKTALANVDSLNEEDAQVLKFPLSMGQPKLDTDKQGDTCTTIDCILNADVLRQCQAYRPLKVFLNELAMNWVGSKYSMKLDPRFKLPKMKYKGQQVEAQRVRLDRKLVTELRDVPEDPTFPLVASQAEATKAKTKAAAGAAAAAAGVGKARSAPAAPQASMAQAGSSRQGAGGKAGSAAAGAGSKQAGAVKHHVLQPQVSYTGCPVTHAEVTVQLPSASAEPQISVSGRQFMLEVPGCDPVQLELKFYIDSGSAEASVCGKGVLQLRLPHLPVPAVLQEVQRCMPHALGSLGLSSRSYLELEA